jgi:hypothetical protein
MILVPSIPNGQDVVHLYGGIQARKWKPCRQGIRLPKRLVGPSAAIVPPEQETIAEPRVKIGTTKIAVDPRTSCFMKVRSTKNVILRITPEGAIEIASALCRPVLAGNVLSYIRSKGGHTAIRLRVHYLE